jgi:hypothetical protein
MRLVPVGRGGVVNDHGFYPAVGTLPARVFEVAEAAPVTFISCTIPGRDFFLSFESVPSVPLVETVGPACPVIWPSEVPF